MPHATTNCVTSPWHDVNVQNNYWLKQGVEFTFGQWRTDLDVSISIICSLQSPCIYPDGVVLQLVTFAMVHFLEQVVLFSMFASNWYWSSCYIYIHYWFYLAYIECPLPLCPFQAFTPNTILYFPDASTHTHTVFEQMKLVNIWYMFM